MLLTARLQAASDANSSPLKGSDEQCSAQVLHSQLWCRAQLARRRLPAGGDLVAVAASYCGDHRAVSVRAACTKARRDGLLARVHRLRLGVLVRYCADPEAI